MPRYHKVELIIIRNVPGSQIFENRHHRIVSYIHRKVGKRVWRGTNKWKPRGIFHGRYIFDNEIHSFGRKISHKSHIDIVTATTPEQYVHSLHILRENRGKNRPLHWKNNEPAIQRPLRKPLKCLFVNKPLDFRQSAHLRYRDIWLATSSPFRWLKYFNVLWFDWMSSERRSNMADGEAEKELTAKQRKNRKKKEAAKRKKQEQKLQVLPLA